MHKTMIYNNRLSTKLFLLTAVLALLCAGCTKGFDKMNTNPNQATEEMLNYDNLSTGSFFVQMQKNVFPIAQQPNFGDEVYQVMQNLAGDIYSGYMGASGLWYSNANNTTYSLIPNWYSQGFSRGFIGVMPAWYSIKKASEVEAPQIYALATIVKVEAMHRIADMYGPLPYINFGSGALKNSYDSQEAIYNKFFEELNEAINILTDFSQRFPSATVLEKYDFIFNGNIQKWIKFANTLKLRLAMRIVYANESKAKEEAEAAVNHPSGVFTTTTDVAMLQHTSNLTYNHPLYIICYNFLDVKMGANMDSFLNGYIDPRISKLFNLSSVSDYRGIRNGINITTKDTYAAGPFSNLNVTSSSSIVWMGPAEAYFLRAEGALRGWNMGGDAKSLYETGVRNSFSFLGVAGADAYLADSLSRPAQYTDPQNAANNIPAGSPLLSTITIKWDPAGTFEANLERIITQKWIACYPDGQEAWSEFRRTHFPKVFPVVVNNSGGLISTEIQIRRLPFPSTEYSNNPSGVIQGIGLLGGSDNGGTKLWWDKK
jgi:hypothetical protein